MKHSSGARRNNPRWMLIKKEQVLERCLPLWGFWLLLAWSLSILGYYYLASAGSVPVGALFSVLDTFNGFSVTRWVSQFSIPLLWNGWILMACTLFGNTILHWTKVPFSGRCERIVFSMGVGLGTCAYCIFLLGLIHWWNAYSMIGLLVLFSAIGLFSIRSMRGPPSMGPNRVNQRWGWMDTVMTVGLVSLLSLNFLGALSPPIFYDTLVYHLAIPRLYAIAGGIVPTPTNLYTGFPFLTEMLYGLSLILSGETTATLLHYSFGVGILFVLLGFALRYYDRRIGLLAGLLFYATPTIAWESWLTGVELSWGFFTLLALYAFINAIRSEEPANHRRWLCLSALCSGWALCTKYLALVYWFPVALLLVAWSDVRFRKFTWKATAQEITLFGGVSLLLLSPWLIKNWVFYGNPLFPFFPTLFPNPSFPPSQVQGLVNDAHARHWGQIIGSPHQWVNVLVFPWQSAMDTSSLGDFVGPVFLALAPLVWSFRPTARSYWSLRVTFIGWWLLWSLSTSMSRLLIPVLAPLSLAIAAALRWGQLPRLLKTLFHLVMFLFVLANGSWIAYYYSLLGGWRSVTGGLSRSEFLSHTQQTYPSPYYSAMEYINQHLPPTGKVLFIGECRSYYCERPFLAASVFNEQPIVTLLKQAGDETDLCRRLKAQGVTHLFLNAAEAVRLGIFNDRFFPVGERETRIWHGFFQRYLQEVFRDTQRDSLGYRALYVYEIVPSPIPGEVFDVPDPLLKVLRLTRAGTG